MVTMLTDDVSDRPEFVDGKDAMGEWVLRLKKNWDDEGALPYNRATWQRAVDFATAVDGPFTQIMPGPDRSIDVHWSSACPPFSLLVNFPDDVDEPASWYGDDKDGGHIFAGQMGQDLAVAAAPKFKEWIGEQSSWRLRP